MVIAAPLQVALEDRPLPQPGPNEVRIKVCYVGYCGTDVTVWQGKHRAAYPVVPGHEFSGKVDALGEGVSNVTCGDTVVAEASYPCHKCDLCLSEHAEFCRNRIALGRTRDGAMAEYVVVPAEIVHPVGQGVDLLEAQSLVAVACAVRAVSRCGTMIGKRAAVVGSGHSALLVAQVLRAAGAGKVALVGGRRQSRLSLAEQLGCDLAISSSSEQLQERLSTVAPGGFDVVVEASGDTSALPLAINIVKPGGKVVVFSTYKEKASGVPLEELYYKEISIEGSRAGTGAYSTAVDLLSSGKVKVRPMVTHVVTMAEAVRGFELAASHDESVFRVVMEVARP
ncbi:MAG: zinc-dependent alcohol dehydrogenase [Bacillota bacterium]